jgi:hypothetical protein
LAQNWNNCLSYIRANLGTKLQNIEIDDQEFILYFKDHTMAEFSLIEPNKSWVMLTPLNIIHRGGILYEFQVPEDIEVIDVHDVYYGSMIATLAGFGSFFFDPTDVVMSNTLNDMLEFLRTVKTFQFIKPNKILFSEMLPDGHAIAELNIEHTNPNTIPSDLYRNLFLKMCLHDAIQMVLANRIKYSNLSSPFGEINLNIDYLNNKLETLKAEITEINDWLPHRELLHIV